ncbi:MAG: anhydro-N-acetylmuramic acid kinase [Planctomycetota bacterium]
MTTTRTAIGCMTGTSLDGLDVAAMRVDIANDITTASPRIEYLAGRSTSLGHVAKSLRSLASGQRLNAAEITEAAHGLAQVHADAIAPLASTHPPDLIALHGQTVFHAPPHSWQLMNPWPVAQQFACPVITDLRGADLAAGGQGAPITPLADWAFFRSPTESRCVVNLGGFCNLSHLAASAPPEAVTARDVCACNQLLDAIAHESMRTPFDRDGAVAESGVPNTTIVQQLEAALAGQHAAHRSLGSGDELQSLAAALARRTEAPELAASGCVAIARVIATAIESRTDRVLLAGGGIHNRRLLAELTAAIAAPCESTDGFGVPATYREAAAIALLGSLARDGIPITLQQVTGRGQRVARPGVWVEP